MTKAIFARRLHPVPVSLERLEQDANGEVLSTFTRAGSDGPLGIKRSLFERLEKRAALISPRAHPVR